MYKNRITAQTNKETGNIAVLHEWNKKKDIIIIFSEIFLFIILFYCFFFPKISQRTARQIYNKTCVASEDSGQPVRPSSVARVLVYPFSDRLETVEGRCD